ncbi:hypothetical protein [Gorillibacterium sp. sgz5001074]|uniref:hypothetical protein n=1 Tax=Gorillibacterium sp. sgz5001074 TaxID=3446695 RepID=UPI003F6794A1
MVHRSPHSFLTGPQGLLLTSLTVHPDGGLMVSSMNGGPYLLAEDGGWTELCSGLPADAVIHRLESDHAAVYACTSRGLWVLRGAVWERTDITAPCYRLRSTGSQPMAAADDGLWVRHGDGWVRTDYAEGPVYDMLATPQMIFMAQPLGLAFFDRYMQTLEPIPLEAVPTGLTVLQGSLLGAAGGSLMIGDKRGRFDLVRFGRIQVLSVAEAGGRVYACTSRGLYRILTWNGKYHLCSVKQGGPVTDLIQGRSGVYAATLFDGVWAVPGTERVRA